VTLARRAAELRHRARKRSAVDALVMALAEPNGVVLSGDARATSADSWSVSKISSLLAPRSSIAFS
jgi:hypothetical protein